MSTNDQMPPLPSVETCIADVMARFPGLSASSQARYYEAVHQELAPLARALERELNEANANMQVMWGQAADQAKRIAELEATCRDLSDELEAANVKAHYATSQAKTANEQRVWIAYNSAEDDEAVMFFTEMPGAELKSRLVLKEYVCHFVRLVDKKEK